MLDARRLQLLHVVGEAGSMTGAANALHYSPSAVSQQVAALERETGLQLLVRLPRGVRLTGAGRTLAEHGAAIERHLRRAREEVEALRDLRAGRVRLASFPSAGATLVPELVSRFRVLHPDVEVSLELREPRESVAAVREGVVDLALVFVYPFGPRPDLSDVRAEVVIEDEVFVALSAEDARARHERLDAAALAGARWIDSADPDCAQMLRHVAAQADFEPRISFESDDYMTVGRLVAGGLGVALVPSLAAAAMPDAVALRPLRPPLVREVAIVTAEQPAPAVSALVALARELAALPVGA